MRFFALLGCYVAEVDSFGRFEPTHPTLHHRSSCPFEDCLNLDDGMGPTGCSETSVANYQYTLHNISEERTSRVHRGGNLKSQMNE